MAEVDIHLKRGVQCECGHLDIAHHLRSQHLTSRINKMFYRSHCMIIKGSSHCDCQKYIPEADFLVLVMLYPCDLPAVNHG